MSTSSIQNMGTTAGTTGSTTGTNSVQNLQTQFLSLLVAQMKNQDPMNPMDNAQVTTQMAQLSTVTGINNLNTSMSALSSSFLSSQLLQSASLIGKSVLAAGNSMALNGTAAFGVDLPQAVDNLSVTIKDAAGNTVRTLNLGAQAQGTVPLQWDGKTDAGTTAANGTYYFSAKAVQGGNSVSATALSQNVVSSISQNAQGVLLNLGSAGPIALTDVKQIL